MRTIWILVTAVLTTAGCSNDDTETTAISPESGVTKAQEVSSAKMVEQTAASKTDPFIKDYGYPGAKFDGRFTMGDVESVAYRTTDDLSRVVAYYRQKMPGSTGTTGSSTYFVKQRPEGGSVTVTVTSMNPGTQIILALRK